MGTIVTISGLPIDIEKVVSYALEQTTYNSNLVQCGIMARSAEFDALANATGTTVNMPFWKDLEGEFYQQMVQPNFQQLTLALVLIKLQLTTEVRHLR